MGQQRWLELIKDYYCSINYHLRKAMSLLMHLVEIFEFFRCFAYHLRTNIIEMENVHNEKRSKFTMYNFENEISMRGEECNAPAKKRKKKKGDQLF